MIQFNWVLANPVWLDPETGWPLTEPSVAQVRTLMNRPWQAVIFDFDGVLVDSGEAYRTALSEEVGPVDTSDWPRVYGMTTEEAIRYAAKETLSETAVAEVGQRIDRSVGQILARLQPVREGAFEALSALSQSGIPLAIASSASHVAIDATLDALGWTTMFEAVVAREDAPRAKPAPDIYSRAVELLALPADSCWAVEDTDIGIRAARQAGLYTVALGGTQDQDALSEANAFFSDFPSLCASDWFAAGLRAQAT